VKQVKSASAARAPSRAAFLFAECPGRRQFLHKRCAPPSAGFAPEELSAQLECSLLLLTI